MVEKVQKAHKSAVRLSVPDEVLNALERHAQRIGISNSAWVLLAISEKLKRTNDEFKI